MKKYGKTAVCIAAACCLCLSGGGCGREEAEFLTAAQGVGEEAFLEAEKHSGEALDGAAEDAGKGSEGGEKSPGDTGKTSGEEERSTGDIGKTSGDGGRSTEESGTISGDGEKSTGDGGEEAKAEAEAVLSSEPQEIYVDVCGAVASPGVYRLPAGSRIFQAVELAGGLLPEAAGEYVNQARSLEDGQQVYVPTREEAEELGTPVRTEEAGAAAKDPGSGGQEPAGSGSGGKIDLNTAQLEELTALTGIGESKARAIIAYREEHGGFSSIEEICQVQGIKEGTFLKIKDKIAVE